MSVVFSHGVACRIRVEWRLPALTSRRGHSPAQETKWPAVGKPRHIIAQFGDEHARRGVTQTRHRRQQGHRGVKRDHCGADVPFQVLDGRFEPLDLGQMQLQQKAMMGGDASMQRFDQLRAAGL